MPKLLSDELLEIRFNLLYVLLKKFLFENNRTKEIDLGHTSVSEVKVEKI